MQSRLFAALILVLSLACSADRAATGGDESSDSGMPDAGHDAGSESDAGSDAGPADAGPADAGHEGWPEQWQAPQVLEALSTDDNDVSPTVTADGLMLCYSSGTLSTSFDIWCAWRANTQSAFSAPIKQVYLSTTENELSPALNADGSELFFVRSTHLYRALWSVDAGAFAAAVAVSELTLPSVLDDGPALSSDGLTLFFDSNRSDIQNNHRELFSARRATPTDAFGTPVLVASLNSVDDFKAPSLSSDNKFIAFCARASNTSDEELRRADHASNGAWLNNRAILFDAPTSVTQACDPAVSADGTLYFHAKPAGRSLLKIFAAAPRW